MGKLQFSFFVLSAFIHLFTLQAFSQNQYNFSKSGEIHDQVIDSWNNYYRDYFTSEIKRRLFQEGDVYVLYDLQIGGLQSFAEMTRRCGDTRQIAEMVDLLNPVFSTLKPISAADSSTGWICTGGNICTAYNFIEKEVLLCSVQFLGLLGSIATNISENIPVQQRTPAEKTFLSNTFNAMAVQLNRWLSPEYFSSIHKKLLTTPADIKDDKKGRFFSDKELWFLTALSDLSELHLQGIQPITDDGRKAFEKLQNKKNGIKDIFDLFLARTTLTKSPAGVRAELDKGFWTYYYDNRYAKYEGIKSPVAWEKDSKNEWQVITVIPWDSSFLSEDAAWDISHSRRLVPAFETFVRNRNNIRTVWGYDNPAFDPVALRQAYANQIVEKIWNGDEEYPLFSNFWSGDNGWYRVAYANQTGRQFAGYPPYGMNNSMPLGGYPVWGAFNPTLNNIFRNTYKLLHSSDSTAKSFIAQYYPGVSGRSVNHNSKSPIQNLSFLSDLVELPYVFSAQ